MRHFLYIIHLCCGMEEANLQLQGPSIAPPTSSSDPSTSHDQDSQVAQAQQRTSIDQQDETAQQQQSSSSSYKASEIASRFIEVIDPNIDTAAPIDSVKGAVTKFGGIRDRKDKRKQGQDEELDMVQVQEEVTEYHKRSVAAEGARSQALLELGRAASAIDKLKLSLKRAQVEDALARQEADLADRRLGELQRAATAVAELEAARAELESMAKVRAAAVAEAGAAVARAREAAAESEEAGKTVEDLAAEVVVLKGELQSSHAAHVEAEEKRLRLALALEEDKSRWQMELEEAQQEARRLRSELMAACELEMKAEAAAQLMAKLKAEPILRKQLEEVKASVERAKDEANFLRVAAASMRDVLDQEKAELAVLRRREALSSASIPSLEEELRRAASELAVAEAAGKAGDAESRRMADQVGEARREAEEAKAKARSARDAVAKAREEAGVAKAAVATVEARLEAVARETLAATTSEEMATASAAALLQPPSKQETGVVTLRVDEYEDLSRRARETEEAAGKRVMEAVKLIKEAKDAEVRILEKLAKAGRRTEQRRQALEASTLEADEAEFERMSAERELRQWRAEHDPQPRAGLAEISVLGDDRDSNPHIVSPRGGYMPRTEFMTAEVDAGQRKTTFFPRMVMFLARRRAQAWK